ncbi:MAG: histidine kinase [Ignavibacteriales bacterium]|nr:histidine kinase [Ignavibacteriales bacterium]
MSKKFLRKSLYTFFCLSLLFCRSIAENPPIDSTYIQSHYSLDVWTSEQGFPAFGISAITQTDDGYLWIATNEGLVRFNGSDFVLFRDIVKEKNHQFDIVRMEQDKKGNLWVITSLGELYRFDRDSGEGKFIRNPLPFPEMNSNVSEIFFDSDSNAWLVHKDNLYKIDSEQKHFREYTSKDGLAGETYGRIYESADKTIWVSSLSYIDSNTFNKRLGFLNKLRHSSQNFSSFHGTFGITSLLQSKENIIWIGTTEGIFKFENFLFKPYFIKSGYNNFTIPALMQDDNNITWMGTETDGIFCKLDGVVSRFPKQEGLPSERVTCLFEDNENSIWVGTRGGALVRLKRKKIFTQYYLNSTSVNNVSSVYEDNKGSLWIGTRFEGLYELDKKNVKHYSVQNGLAGNSVRAIGEEANGNYIFGTENGLSRLVNGKFENLTNISELLFLQIRAIYRDKFQQIWVGRSALNFSKFSPNSTKKFLHFVTFINPTQTGVVRGFAEDKNGDLWIATRGGIQFLKNDSLHSYNVRDGLPSDDIMTITFDSSDVLWIGTYNGGLSRFYNNKFTNYSMVDGLVDNVIYHILEDDFGNMWFGSNRGIFRIKKQELNDFAEGKIFSVNSVSYGISDGMLSAECNGGSQPSCWKTKDGRLLFATMKGVAIVDPKQIFTAQTTLPPPVVIERFVANEDTVILFGGTELEAGKKKLEFDYAALSFIAPEKNRFKFKLENFDDNWTDAGNRRRAYYTNVPAGTYTFRVIACNQDGIWNKQGAALTFTIRPFLWEARWFQVFSFIIISFIVFSLFKIRVRSVRNAEERKTGLNKQIAQLEMKALRAQMNPHFIFNCLNSIQGCILANETEVAYTYLSKFAKLLRMILENSEHTFVPLTNELAMLRLYLELESLSYDHKFSHTITIDPVLGREEYEIPTLLIQPYVENAIWHGLIHKQGERKLSIQFEKNEDYLHCTIEDNGIGREKARKLEEPRKRGYEPRGMKVTRERIKTLNAYTGKEATVNVTDLYSEKNESLGTRVEIKIPLE